MASTLISAPTKAPAKISWQLLPLKAKFDSVLSDAYQIAQWSPGIWVVGATFNGLVLDDQDAIGAWLLQLDDGTYRTFWYDYSRPNPRGVGTGSPIYVDNWCIDPTYATPADWTLGTGWSIGSNKLTAAAASTGIGATMVVTNNDRLIQGAAYNITWKVSGYSAGSVQVKSTGTGGSAGAAHNANGTYTDQITIGSSRTFQFNASATFTGSVDSAARTCLAEITDMHIIKTKGWTAATAHIMKAHDWFDVLANGHRELKRLIATCDSDANGVAILSFKPILRNYPADGTALTINQAGTYFMLVQDVPWSVDLPNVSDGITIALAEDIKA